MKRPDLGTIIDFVLVAIALLALAYALYMGVGL